MTPFQPIAFDPAACRNELDRLQALLAAKRQLSERDDLLPLFKQCPQLCALLGTRFPNIGLANRLAYEFQIFGDYKADIVIGNYERKCFCAVELEDARPNCIFNRLPGRANGEWGRRLEHGFGQLIDWFFRSTTTRIPAALLSSLATGISSSLVCWSSADLTIFPIMNECGYAGAPTEFQ